jgi:hypothetical protein
MKICDSSKYECAEFKHDLQHFVSNKIFNGKLMKEQNATDNNVTN